MHLLLTLGTFLSTEWADWKCMDAVQTEWNHVQIKP